MEYIFCFSGLQNIRLNKVTNPSLHPKLGAPVGVGLMAATFLPTIPWLVLAPLKLEQVALKIPAGPRSTMTNSTEIKANRVYS